MRVTRGDRERIAKRASRAAAIAVAAAVVWLTAGSAVRADEAAFNAALDAGPFPDHAACSLFGSERHQLIDATLGAELARAQARTALTQGVLQSLPAWPRPQRARARGWTEQNVSSGPIVGDSIDELVFGRLERDRIPAAPPTTDAEFLRRVSLDLTGRIPTQDQVLAFRADASPDKRAAKIDQLLATPEWADRWTMFFGDLFRNTQRTAQVNRYPFGRDALHLYLLESLGQNKPYDQMAREMLIPVGTNDGRPWPVAVGDQQPFSSYDQYLDFLRNEPVVPNPASHIVGGFTTGGPVNDTYDAMAVNVGRDFLGIAHVDCVLCHDGVGHLESLNLWGAEAKRSELWGLASFFEKVRLQRPNYFAPPRPGSTQVRGPRPPYWIVRELGDSEVQRNRRGRTLAGEYRLNTEGGNRPSRTPADNNGQELATPKYPFGGGTVSSGESRRAALGRLLTADRQFARAAVNYLWKEFFGRGIVDPVDQFDLNRIDPANPPPDPWTLQPSQPELLEHLADSFINSGFDLKAIMREITASETYQLSSTYDAAWNPAYDAYFARHHVRRLSAEELHDALVVSSGVPVPYQTTRAVGPTPFAMQFPDVQGFPAAGRNLQNFSAQAAAFLDAFFRGDREESPRSGEPSILQALQLMNNALVDARVTSSSTSGALAALLGQNDETLVGLLYVRVLGRLATPPELSQGVAHLQSGDRTQAAQDLMWSLYNKVDFIFNY